MTCPCYEVDEGLQCRTLEPREHKPGEEGTGRGEGEAGGRAHPPGLAQGGSLSGEEAQAGTRLLISKLQRWRAPVAAATELS